MLERKKQENSGIITLIIITIKEAIESYQCFGGFFERELFLISFLRVMENHIINVAPVYPIERMKSFLAAMTDT